MAETHIQWSERVWNPTTGCDKVSPGCGLPRPGGDDEETGQTGGCYALTMAKRLKGMGQAKYQRDGDPRTSGPGFGLTIHEDVLREPLRWRKPSKVFVNSMSDLFHADVPDEFLAKVFAVMAAAPQHTFQILTKRHARMRSLLNSEKFAEQMASEMAVLWNVDKVAPLRGPLPNVWLGVSCEDQHWADIRIPALVKTPAAVRFVSAEPLLGPIKLHRGHAHCPTHDFTGCFCSGPCPDLVLPNWLIVGGESGRGARPMEVQWARDLVADCRDTGIAPFVKQLGTAWARDWTVGGKTVAAHGDPKGGDPQYWPADLRVREFPQPVGVSA